MTRGAPSLPYDEAVAAQFCEMIEDGMTLRQACAVEGIPSWPTIRKWLRANEDFATQYARV